MRSRQRHNGLWLAVVVCLMATSGGEMLRYDGDKIISVTVDDKESYAALTTSIVDGLLTGKADILREPTFVGSSQCHVFVSESYFAAFTDIMIKHGFEHDVFTHNVQELMDEEAGSIEDMSSAEIRQRQRREAGDSHIIIPDVVLGTYANYSTTMDWLLDLEQMFDFVELELIGQTHEERDLVVVKIGVEKDGVTKPAVWIDGAVHAREWISPATVNYIIYHLIDSHLNQSYNVSFLDDLDWYFLPIANPDGYQYTFDHDRLWRKNRFWSNSTHGFRDDRRCVGTDINRNFPFKWGTVNSWEGIPCLPSYRGPHPASEIETRAIMEFVTRHNNTLKAFVSVHSYSQLVMSRYAYNRTVTTPDDHEELSRFGLLMTNAIRNTHNANYTFGVTADILYAYSGGSSDWARADAGIKYSYTLELRDRGHFGFLLPTNYTDIVGSEIWAGIRVVGRELSKIYVEVDTTSYGRMITPSFCVVVVTLATIVQILYI